MDQHALYERQHLVSPDSCQPHPLAPSLEQYHNNGERGDYVMTREPYTSGEDGDAVAA